MILEKYIIKVKNDNVIITDGEKTINISLHNYSSFILPLWCMTDDKNLVLDTIFMIRTETYFEDINSHKIFTNE